jgi:hypothetical protein
LLPLLSLLLILFTSATAQAFPQPPNIFWGPVYIGDSLAPDGLQIVAKLSIREGDSLRLQTFSTTTTFQGNYGTRQRLAISGDDPDTPEKEGAAEGEPVFFFLVTPEGELPAEQEPPAFRIGRTSKVALHFVAGGPKPALPPVGPRLSPASKLEGGLGKMALSTVGVVVSNFTDAPQQQHLTLLQGNEVVQRLTVLVADHAAVGVEFEVAASDLRSYRVQSSGAPGSITALAPGVSRLIFDNLRILPPKVANGKLVLVTADVSNPSSLLVHRQVFLRVAGKPAGPPRDVLVGPGEVQSLDFEYTPVALKVGPVPVMVGDATGILAVVDPPPLGLYIPLLVFGPLMVLGIAAWLYWSRVVSLSP